jgi:hypothetical protein
MNSTLSLIYIMLIEIDEPLERCLHRGDVTEAKCGTAHLESERFSIQAQSGTGDTKLLNPTRVALMIRDQKDWALSETLL